MGILLGKSLPEIEETINELESILSIPQVCLLYEQTIAIDSGNEVEIEESTIDDALDCVKHFIVENINESNITEEQKMQRKVELNSYIEQGKIVLKQRYINH